MHYAAARNHLAPDYPPPTGNPAEISMIVPNAVLGVITSLQEQVEWTLRVASLLVGLAVGIMSLVAMERKWRGR